MVTRYQLYRRHVLDIFFQTSLQNYTQILTNMKTPLRIAILQCDTPPPHVVELYGAYDRIFTTLLEKAASGLGLDPDRDLSLSAWEVVTKQEYPNIGDIDAVLISGSSTWPEVWIIRIHADVYYRVQLLRQRSLDPKAR